MTATALRDAGVDLLNGDVTGEASDRLGDGHHPPRADETPERRPGRKVARIANDAADVVRKGEPVRDDVGETEDARIGTRSASTTRTAPRREDLLGHAPVANGIAKAPIELDPGERVGVDSR